VTYYLPPSTVLYTGSLRGTLSVVETFSPRWTGILAGSYGVAGGLDFPSQQSYPPTRGGAGDAAATYTMSREDALQSGLHADYTYVLTTTDKFFIVTYLESIRHSFSSHTTGALGAGVSTVVRKLARQNALSGAVTGAGDASLTHTVPFSEGGMYTFRAGANLGQGYNPYLGIVQFLGTASASSMWARDPWSVSATVTAATSIPVQDVDAARVGTGTLTFGYALGRAATVQTGVRGYTQLLPSQVGATYSPQWVVFLALVLTAPPLKF
jgi:hypothetical protein